MSDLRLNSHGDLDVSGFDLSLVTDSEAIAQQLRIRLRHFLGEWFLDTSFGVPYFNDILIKNPNPVVVDAAFQNAILTTPGVVELQAFDSRVDRATRTLRIAFRVLTREGVLTVDEVLP